MGIRRSVTVRGSHGLEVSNRGDWRGDFISGEEGQDPLK